VGFTPCAMTEWDEPEIRDCLWASGLMLANKATLGAIACVRAEREALARAAGKPEGQEAGTLADLRTGMLERYGWAGRIEATSTIAATGSTLGPARGAVVIGWYAKLPAHFTRFDPAFAAKGAASLHAVYAEHRPDLGSSQRWIIDPLFHAEPGYRGEPITLAALFTYATGFGGPGRLMVVDEGQEAGSIGDVLIYRQTDEAGSFVIEPATSPKFYRLGATGWELAKTWAAIAGPSSASFEGILRRLAGSGPSNMLHVTSGFGAGLYVASSAVTEKIDPPKPADCAGEVGAALEDYRTRILAVPTVAP
jgi:hypothetical protein